MKTKSRLFLLRIQSQNRNKGRKKRLINNTVLNEEDAYKWQTELNFEDHEHPNNNEAKNEELKDVQDKANAGIEKIHETGVSKKSKTKKRKKTGRTMVNDPLAVEIANENMMIHTEHGTKIDENSVKQEENKAGVNQAHIEISEEEESNFEDKLNKLREESDDALDNLAPPMVAVGPHDNGKAKVSAREVVPANAAQQAVQENNDIIADPDAIDQLQEMFPAIESETIKEYYKICGGNLQRTFNFIGQQMNMYQDDAGEHNPRPNVSQPNGISPDDIQLNMLAGNDIGGQVYDPNIISIEERKMIEQALRDSEIQEREALRARQAQLNQSVQMHANQAFKNLNVVKSEQQRGNEIVSNSRAQMDANTTKAVNKVDKKDGKNCCIIF